MKDLLDKISSYNLFNYLFPGILFVVFLKQFTDYDLILENNLLGAFFYYFIGLVISRIGSLIIAPILRFIKFIKFSEYKDFVKASKVDEDIKLFSEVNNTYRTLISMFFMLFFLKLVKYIAVEYKISDVLLISIALILLFILFVFAYKKQTKFITDRIDFLKQSNKI